MIKRRAALLHSDDGLMHICTSASGWCEQSMIGTVKIRDAAIVMVQSVGQREYHGMPILCACIILDAQSNRSVGKKALDHS